MLDAYRPNLPERMKQLVDPAKAIPALWAKTYEFWGVTEDEVRAAQTAEMERRIREAVEVVDE